ncbi:unannotated protein [freshwater metagenome]|uniref:Unannotated protein n=1 Tax=freshwater metagenome TaxID=449393 RepID=A0A6J6FL30_9ZZZZ|nr:hypothetical protein [Actinomycetota bacterium]MSZ14802.1 hypothetical protein [Actinomycetota bacterium]MTA19384.1 hypothetical protein [Actinomycetota bacterium]MTA87868.1 hypothetical protein [Actinomycetota bacterium]MTB01614.1 hypothetical protein [Actinomycetota bacterium]
MRANSRSPRHPRTPFAIAALAALVVIAAAACGSSTTKTSSRSEGAPLKVAASIPPIQNLVATVGGDRVEVISVVPAGVDGHTYEPTSADVRALADVSILFLPDFELNPKVTELAGENLADDAKIVDLNALTVPEDDLLFVDSHSHGDGVAHGHQRNVHTWTNPVFVVPMIDEIANALIAADPDGAETYEANRDALKAEIAEFEVAARTALDTVPEANRTLVVYHDSWSYFGREYGFEVVGALQAVDFAEPSAAEMRRMVDQVSEAGVPAFFGSEVFPTSVLEQVATESGVEYVGNLSDDKLPGEEGAPENTYLGMMVSNVRYIVNGLGGDSSALDAFEPARG